MEILPVASARLRDARTDNANPDKQDAGRSGQDVPRASLQKRKKTFEQSDERFGLNVGKEFPDQSSLCQVGRS